MATIKTLLGNVKGKDGGGYEEVVLYSGTCSACISSNVATSTSPMIKMSESIENYSSIRIEFQFLDKTSSGEGAASTSSTFSTEYIKKVYTHSSLVSTIAYGNVSVAQIFSFYDATHLVLMWELYTGIAHNMSHITVTGIRDKVPDAEKNFNKYSTTEEVVGTWIDGKPIYRKCFNYTSNGSATFADIADLSSLNIDIVCNISGYQQVTNPAPYIASLSNAYNNTTYSAPFYDLADKHLYLNTNLKSSGVIVLEYTKTTD